MPRKISPQQLRLLPTVAEIRQQKQAAHERAQRTSIRCWQCRCQYPPGAITTHPDTGCEICAKCEATHPSVYELRISRAIERLEVEA